MDLGTASTTPPTSRAPEEPLWDAAAVGDGPIAAAPADNPVTIPVTPAKRSLARRMMAIAALWIGVLLLGGGFALDRTLVRLVEDNFDEQLEYVQTALIASAEIDMDGEVLTDRLRWREAEEVKFAGFANPHPRPIEAEFWALDFTEPHRFVERHTRTNIDDIE